jgi:hypothetical protein
VSALADHSHPGGTVESSEAVVTTQASAITAAEVQVFAAAGGGGGGGGADDDPQAPFTARSPPKRANVLTLTGPDAVATPSPSAPPQESTATDTALSHVPGFSPEQASIHQEESSTVVAGDSSVPTVSGCLSDFEAAAPAAHSADACAVRGGPSPPSGLSIRPRSAQPQRTIFLQPPRTGVRGSPRSGPAFFGAGDISTLTLGDAHAPPPPALEDVGSSSPPAISVSTYLDGARRDGLLRPVGAAAGVGTASIHLGAAAAAFAASPPSRRRVAGTGGGHRRLTLDECFADDAAFAYGWIDAPPGCVDVCGLLLRACRRHPAQKAAFLCKAREDEAAAVRAERFASTSARHLAAAAALAGRAAAAAVPADDEDDARDGAMATVIDGPLDVAALSAWRVWDLTGGRISRLCCAQHPIRAAALVTGAPAPSAAPGVRLSSAAAVLSTQSSAVLTVVPVSPPLAMRSSRGRGASDEQGGLLREGEDDDFDDADPGNPARHCGCLSYHVMTLQSLAAYGAALAYMAWCLFYLVLFAFAQPAGASRAFVLSWAWTQCFVIFLLQVSGAWRRCHRSITAQASAILYTSITSTTQPAISLAIVLWGVVLWPAWVPYLLWIPRLGPLLAGRKSRAAVAQASGAAPTDSVLTGRIENLTLVRAAGYASALSPDAAVIAYGASAVMATAMGGVARLLRRIADSRRPAGGGGGHLVGGTQRSSQQQSEAVDAAARSELVVRRYLLGQLRMAELRSAKAGRV